MASVSNGMFVSYVLSTYTTFRSYGKDEFWDEHSVRLLAEIPEQHPTWLSSGQLTTVNATSFHAPLWDAIDSLYDTNRRIDSMRTVYRLYPHTVSFHLWNSVHKVPHGASMDALCEQSKGSVYGQVVCLIK
jgi:hypothetical protein